MPDRPTARQLIEILSSYAPDTPVQLDSPGSSNGNGHRSQRLTATLSEGTLHLASGQPPVEAAGTPVFLHAVLRHRTALEELSGLTGLTLPSSPIVKTATAQHELHSITAGTDDPRQRTAMILEGRPEAPQGEEPRPTEYLLVLTVDQARAQDAEEATARAGTLSRISGNPARPLVATVTAPEQWADRLPAPCHALQWTERLCPICQRSFRTERGLRIHLMLEQGTADLDSTSPRYWQRYMDDLRQLTEDIPQNFQKQAAYRPRP